MQDLATLDRRGLLQHLGLLLGAAALPADALIAAKAAKTKAALSPARFKLLTALADTIVPRTETPGAVQAGVPRVIDNLLANWASPKRREELTGALDRIDALAREQGAKTFAALPAARRKTLLTPYDEAALKPIPRTDGLRGITAMMAGPAVTDAGYGKLKELIVVLYYTSEIGLTHELSYTHAPGVWRPSVPVTPETRVPGGAGGLV